MDRLLTLISVLVVLLLQILQSALGVTTQIYEQRSEYPALLLLLTTLTPLLGSLFVVDSLPVRGRSMWLAKICAVLLTCYVFTSCFFSLYRIGRKFSFDFFWFWYNLSDAYRSLIALDERVPFFILLILLFAILHYCGLIKIYSRLGVIIPSHNQAVPAGVHRTKLLVGIALFVGTHYYMDNEPSKVAFQAIKPTPAAAILYTKFFEDSLIQNKSNAPSDTRAGDDRNLFLVHLESLNARLTNPTITPHLLRHARTDGVLFPEIQSPSVLTIRAQESILCSILPALKQNIASQSDLMSGLACLPRVLQQRGFKTLYFHSYPSFRFANREIFLKAIGFDELHAADIMKPGDTTLSWGYREDVYYKRVFEFLERYRGHKIFAYIGINTTNHYPFYDEEKKAAFPQFTQTVPFPRPSNLREELANTTHIQDKLFSDMYEHLYRHKFSATSHMIAFGDHSWPIGIHKNNYYSENHAYQENFVTSLAFFPAAQDRQKFKIGAQITALHSYLDLMPTIAELFGIHGLRYYGQSFLADTLSEGSPRRARCAVAVQPFSGGYITTIDYPHKQIFNLNDNSVTRYDLRKDPDEASPLSKKLVDAEALRNLEVCLKSLRP